MKMMFGLLILLAMVSVTYPAVDFSGTMDVLGHILSFVDLFTEAKAIQHPASGKCLNVENNLAGGGVRLILWDCNWGFAMPVNERFFLDRHGDSVLLKGSMGFAFGFGACLYTGNNNEDPLYTIGCNENDKRQQFQFGDVGDKRFVIKQVESGRCLRAMSNDNSAWIRAVDCNEGDGQQIWRICSYDGKCG